MNAQICLVCATIRGPFAAEATCSKCSATIFPQRKSMERVLAERLPMICVDCYAKLDDMVFGGFMHHGRMLPEAQAERLFLEFEQALVRDKIARRPGDQIATQ